MKKEIFLICLLASMQAVSAMADCLEVRGQSLNKVTIDLTYAILNEQPIKCSEQATTKSCQCAIVGREHLRGAATFKITPFTFGTKTFGTLVAPNPLGEGLTVPIICHDTHDGSGRTPNMSMIRQFMAHNPDMVQGCTFSNRPKYQDELTQPNVGQAKNGNGSYAKRALIVDALSTANGDTTQAAKKLGISEKALSRKMKEVNILISIH